LEPWGDDWLQTGIIASAAVNPHIKRQMKAEDFMPPKKPKVSITDGSGIERFFKGLCGVE
jgi:hypothetical protein